MVNFKKKYKEENLIQNAIDYLNRVEVPFKEIKLSQADKESSVNSKSMVLMSFTVTDKGIYQLTVKDKGFYSYTQKLLRDILRLRISSIDKEAREITAESEQYGKMLDVIEILAIKYTLSIVTKK